MDNLDARFAGLSKDAKHIISHLYDIFVVSGILPSAGTVKALRYLAASNMSDALSVDDSIRAQFSELPQRAKKTVSTILDFVAMSPKCFDNKEAASEALILLADFAEAHPVPDDGPNDFR